VISSVLNAACPTKPDFEPGVQMRVTETAWSGFLYVTVQCKHDWKVIIRQNEDMRKIA
jgi:hypothetical protein